jgi:predicted DNA-binding transcriptional regulator AlpA
MARQAALPPTLAPRLVSREGAAAYACISPNKFDEMVRDGRMPKARRIDARKVWDIRELDAAIDGLPVDGSAAQNAPSLSGWEDIDAA